MLDSGEETSPGHRASYSVKYSPSRSTLFFVTVSYIKKMLLYLSKSQCSRVPNPPQVCLTHTLPPTVVTRPTAHAGFDPRWTRD